MKKLQHVHPGRQARHFPSNQEIHTVDIGADEQIYQMAWSGGDRPRLSSLPLFDLGVRT